MKFTLHYRGPLKASGSRRDKHTLRRHFHKQLKALYEQSPLWYHWQSQLQDPDGSLRRVIRRSMGLFEFLPVVHSDWFLAAGLNITLLRPEPPGKIVTQSGDIDNRLKTLLDALKGPDLGIPTKRRIAAVRRSAFSLFASR